MPEFSPPIGPHAVGSIAQLLIDSNRLSNLTSLEKGRAILVKAWYPADISGAGDYNREALWEQLQHDAEAPKLLRWFVNRLKNTRTHTYRQAPIQLSEQPPPVIENSHHKPHFPKNGQVR